MNFSVYNNHAELSVNMCIIWLYIEHNYQLLQSVIDNSV